MIIDPRSLYHPYLNSKPNDGVETEEKYVTFQKYP